ncbi:MAG: tetratricopeptide repeat protein [candidate division KSB1 bacterium]|nr:tetratricopeptide repeat protein [candidate division KSB1 bacterium]
MGPSYRFRRSACGTVFLLLPVLILGCARTAGRPPLVLVLPHWSSSQPEEATIGLAASASLALRQALAGRFRLSGVPEVLTALPLDSLAADEYCLRIGRRVGAKAVLLLRWGEGGPQWTLVSSQSPSRDLGWQPLAQTWAEAVAAVSQRLGGGLAETSIPVPSAEELREVGTLFLALAAGESLPTDAFNRASITELQGWARGEVLLHQLAELNRAKKDLTEGLFRLGKHLRDQWGDSASYEWQRLRGAYFVFAQRWNLAEQWLAKAYRRNARDGRTLYWLAHLHASRLRALGLRHPEHALRRAVECDPFLFEARIMLAELYFQNRKFRAAQQEAEALLALNPVHEDGLMLAGRIAIGLNDIPRTLEIYKRVVDLNPLNADAYYNLGIVYFHTGHLADAEALFRRAVEINDHADAHFYLARIYEKVGLREKAAEEYRIRVRLRKGADDPFADQARKRLAEIGSLAPDSLSTPR